MADKSYRKPEDDCTTNSEPVETTKSESGNDGLETAVDSSQCADSTNTDVTLPEDDVCRRDVTTNHVAATIGSHVTCDSDPNAAGSDVVDDVTGHGTSPATDAEIEVVEERWAGPEAGQVCTVCGDKAAGMYFGALVCVPCKVSTSSPMLLLLFVWLDK
jgi:hypothetical protein